MQRTAGQAKSSMERVLAETPVVRELVECLRRDQFQFDPGVFVFGIQHVMDQTLALCWALNALGIAYDRIALCGKAYSYCPDVAEELRALGVIVEPAGSYDPAVSQASQMVDDLKRLAARVAIRRSEILNPSMLILDDGGQALTNVAKLFSGPNLTWGVEQTASGFWQPGIGSVGMPVVDVGASAVKGLCEPPIIIDAALRHAFSRIDAYGDRPQVGVIGLGHIGLTLSHVLRDRGYRISVYDHRPGAYYRLEVQRARRVHDVINSSDIIFGCTGSDVTRDLQWDVSQRGLEPRSREFVSLSSGDDEFFTLKTLLLSEGGAAATRYSPNSIPDIVGSFSGSEFRIARNGFPINFDNSRLSAPLSAIQGTMAALVGALCQVYLTFSGRRRLPLVSERVVLDLAFQRWLLKRWRKVLDRPVQFRSRPVSSEPQDSMLMRISHASRELNSVETAPVFGAWTEC